MNKYRQKVQDWLSKMTEKDKENFLFWFSFFESFLLILPPPDPFLIYVVFTNTRKWVRYSFLVVLASVIGGILSYIFGYFFFEIIKDWLLGFQYVANEFENAKTLFNQNSFWAIFLAAFTPLPYTVFTIAAGVFKTNIFLFVLASIIGRGLRFFVVGAISAILGKRFADLFVKYFDLIAIFVIVAMLLYLFL